MRISNKIISMVMVLLLVVGMLPISTMTVFAADTHKHCVCGGNTDIGDHTAHSDIAFTEWTSTDSMPDTAGNYVLLNDVTISDNLSWKPSDGIVLCLNGHTLTLTAISAYYDFTLCDCTGNGKIVGSGESVYTIAMASTATFTMYGGTVSGSESVSGVYVYGRFNMYGGTVGDCGSVGVQTKNNGTFNMYGGIINGNRNANHGGGVRLDGGTFNMYGGAVTSNESFSGSGVFVDDGAVFNMSGGMISENYAESFGGGVELESGSVFVMTGGEISGNRTSDNETRQTYGGGVFVTVGADMTVSGNSVVKGNTASNGGNNVHLQYATGQAYITIGDLADGADIGISMYEYGVFSVGGKDNSQYFTADNPDYMVAVDGENLKLVKAEVQVGKVTLKNGEYTTDGKEKTPGEPTGEGYAYFKNGVLTLNNFEYEGVGAVNSENGGAGKGIIYTTNDLDIEIIGDNIIKDTSEESYPGVVYVPAILNIYGGGNLTIHSLKNTGIRAFGLTAKDVTFDIDSSGEGSVGLLCHNSDDEDFCLENVTANIRAEEGGIVGGGTVEIENCNIDIVVGERGIRSESYIEIINSKIIVVSSNLALTQNKGEIKLVSGQYILEGNNEEFGAIYTNKYITLTFPITDYYYRTGKDENFVKSSDVPFAYDKQMYIEIFTEDRSVPVEIEWYGDTSFAYDETEKSVAANIRNKADGDIVELVLSENTATDAGVYTATVTGLTGKDAAKYTLDGVQNLTLSWEIIKGEQATPSTPVGMSTTYIDTTDGKITGVDSTMEYRKEGETAYTAVVGTEIINLSAGTYYVRYAEKPNYNASPDTEIVISEGGKRTPNIDIEPTASRIIIGGKLSDSTLTGGVASVPGEFAWVNTDAVMNTAGKFDMLVRFTPNDDATYKTVDFEIEVEVVVCDTSSGKHDYTEQKNDANEHWAVCAKCEIEQPNSREAHSGGTATCTAKAKCEVCDTEYGDIGVHNYENGKCTVCDAADPNYVPDSPQTGDPGVTRLWIIMVASLVGIVALIGFSKKRRAI